MICRGKVATLRGWYRYLVLVLALAGATLVFFEYYPRYRPVGPPLFADSDFTQGLDAWEHSVGEGIETETGRLRLQATGFDRSVYLRQRIAAPPPGTLIGIRAQLKVEDVWPGPKPWNRASIVLQQSAQTDGNGVFAGWEVIGLAGSSDWVPVDRIIPVDAAARGLTLSLNLDHARGTVEFQSLRVRAVAESPGARVIYVSLIFAWALIFLSGLYRLWTLLSARGRWVLGLFVALLLGGILLPGKLKYAVSDQVLRWSQAHLNVLGGWLEPDGAARLISTLTFYSPKIGHFLFFLFAALFLARALPRSIGLRHILISLTALGAVTELLQRFVPGRTPSLRDIAINAAGAVFGLMIAHLLPRPGAVSPG